MRTVHGVPPRTNAEQHCFGSNILSLKRLHSYNISIFMYKFSKNMLPEWFEFFFSNVATIHEHNIRSARLNHIYIQFKGTTRGQKAFCYSGPLYVISSYSTWIFCRGVSGFATDCPCDIWCRGLTTCLLHVGPPFGNRFLNTSWALGLVYWIVYLHFFVF